MEELRCWRLEPREPWVPFWGGAGAPVERICRFPVPASGFPALEDHEDDADGPVLHGPFALLCVVGVWDYPPTVAAQC
jgi:hypothetical protein